jgi:hypothetical protein
LHYHQPEEVLQVRSVSTAIHGKEGAVFHGQGAASEHPKDDLLTYFRSIDKALHGFLRDQQAPLLFAGVEYLFPIYCRANRYPHLLERPIAGNKTHVKPEELHRKAVEVLTPYWHRDQSQDLKHLERSAGTDQVSSDLKEILPAAFDGRIEALFVAADVEPWGHFDRASGRVELTARHEPGSDELLDLAAQATIRADGRVYAVPSAELPEGRLASASFRHSLARAGLILSEPTHPRLRNAGKLVRLTGRSCRARIKIELHGCPLIDEIDRLSVLAKCGKLGGRIGGYSHELLIFKAHLFSERRSRLLV